LAELVAGGITGVPVGGATETDGSGDIIGAYGTGDGENEDEAQPTGPHGAQILWQKNGRQHQQQPLAT
jgi:hypothetical protein